MENKFLDNKYPNVKEVFGETEEAFQGIKQVSWKQNHSEAEDKQASGKVSKNLEYTRTGEEQDLGEDKYFAKEDKFFTKEDAKAEEVFKGNKEDTEGREQVPGDDK